AGVAVQHDLLGTNGFDRKLRARAAEQHALGTQAAVVRGAGRGFLAGAWQCGRRVGGCWGRLSLAGRGLLGFFRRRLSGFFRLRLGSSGGSPTAAGRRAAGLAGYVRSLLRIAFAGNWLGRLGRIGRRGEIAGFVARGIVGFGLWRGGRGGGPTAGAAARRAAAPGGAVFAARGSDGFAAITR